MRAALVSAACAALLAALVAAGTEPVAAQPRQQFLLGSQTESAERGRQLYAKELQKARDDGRLVVDGEAYEKVKAVAERIATIASEVRPDADSWAWEVNLLRSDAVNAYCLPGGKIIVLTGLLERLEPTEDELGAILGHEAAHALLEHSREKTTQQTVSKVAVGLLAIAAAVVGARYGYDPSLILDATAKTGTAASELLVHLPFSRAAELEADRIGAELAARAGYDPRAAVSIFEKMGRLSGQRIEFLATHPNADTRVSELGIVVSPLADQFASRRIAPVASQAAPVHPAEQQANRSGMLEEITCQLPDGTNEALSLLACTRLGGRPREESK